MTEYQEITYSISGDVGIVTINRPAARNALTLLTYEELRRVVLDADVRCLIITGADPSFCSGDDVKEILAAPEGPPDVAPHLLPVSEAWLYTDIPVIAAVNGPAVGWGMELALMADIRVASEHARFGELFIKRGICSDVAGFSRLAGLVGREKASEILFTGDIFDAEEAQRIGLVSRVVPHSELLETAMNLAQRIARNPPLAVQRIKAGLRDVLDPDFRELGVWVAEAWAELLRTEDHQEGVKAFIEKRPPKYRGR